LAERWPDDGQLAETCQDKYKIKICCFVRLKPECILLSSTYQRINVGCHTVRVPRAHVVQTMMDVSLFGS
jgi:hypothetical protein